MAAPAAAAAAAASPISLGLIGRYGVCSRVDLGADQGGGDDERSSSRVDQSSVLAAARLFNPLPRVRIRSR